jgi:hypothetical protein
MKNQKFQTHGGGFRLYSRDLIVARTLIHAEFFLIKNQYLFDMKLPIIMNF